MRRIKDEKIRDFSDNPFFYEIKDLMWDDLYHQINDAFKEIKIGIGIETGMSIETIDMDGIFNTLAYLI